MRSLSAQASVALSTILQRRSGNLPSFYSSNNSGTITPKPSKLTNVLLKVSGLSKHVKTTSPNDPKCLLSPSLNHHWNRLKPTETPVHFQDFSRWLFHDESRLMEVPGVASWHRPWWLGGESHISPWITMNHHESMDYRLSPGLRKKRRSTEKISCLFPQTLYRLGMARDG